MKLSELLASARLTCPAGCENIQVKGITADSRYNTDSAVFICLRGEKYDGHNFIGQAVAAGAVAVVAEKGTDTTDTGVPVIKVRNTRLVYPKLVSAMFGHPEKELKIIGITGTNGKTSTSYMLYHIICTAGVKCGLIGTLGCISPSGIVKSEEENPLANLTTPDPGEMFRILRLMKNEGAEYVVAEITSQSLALSKVAPIRFTGGIFTNLSPEHLDAHGDMETYFLTKARMFAKCGFAIINTSDPYGRRLHDLPTLGCRAVSCSYSAGADYTASDIICTQNGVQYNITSENCRFSVRCPVPGEFTVMNSFEAAACASELGFGTDVIRCALSSFCGVTGRMESVPLPGADFTVIIDFAHTPDAIEKLLRTVRGFRQPGGRVVILFGCGGDRDRSKRKLMGSVASRLADFLIITSDNSRSEDPGKIIGDIIRGVDKEREHTVITDRREAIKYAIRTAGSGDVIILAGKGHEDYEIDADGKHPFSEKDIVTGEWSLSGGHQEK